MWTFTETNPVSISREWAIAHAQSALQMLCSWPVETDLYHEPGQDQVFTSREGYRGNKQSILLHIPIG